LRRARSAISALRRERRWKVRRLAMPTIRGPLGALVQAHRRGSGATGKSRS
jgi:hypothetical protein